jgi:hypothetical protein
MPRGDLPVRQILRLDTRMTHGAETITDPTGRFYWPAGYPSPATALPPNEGSANGVLARPSVTQAAGMKAR